MLITKEWILKRNLKHLDERLNFEFIMKNGRVAPRITIYNKIEKYISEGCYQSSFYFIEGVREMPQTTEAQPMDTTQKEIVEMKTDIKSLQKEVQELKQITTRHDGRIQAIENMLNNINENTTWLKRTITNAIIGAVCTGFIGGGIAIVFTVFEGGN